MNDFVVFDLETQRSADEVGGWSYISEMKMAIGVVWDSKTKNYHIYQESEVNDLIEHLENSQLIIGFNHIGFDFVVLSGYINGEQERSNFLKKLKKLNNLDLLLKIKEKIGRRIKLDTIARGTLQVGKSADGVESLKWYKEYLQGDDQKLQMIIEYCKKDVEVTRDIYLYGVEKGELLYEDYQLGLQKIKVDWGKEIETDDSDSSTQLSF